jgi:DNA-binding NarL/FixJ family response regulator
MILRDVCKSKHPIICITCITKLLLKKIRIIITDDHVLYSRGVRNALLPYTNIEVLAEAVNGQDLLDKLEYLRPDVVITGIQMPVMDGIALVPILKQRYPGIKIIMLTMMDDASIIKKMISLGANAYLTKTSPSEKIYEAIITCSNNWLHINDTVRDALIKDRPGYPETKSDFNNIELVLMEWYCKNIPMSNIANQLNLSERTVAAVLDRLFFKTKTNDAATLVKFAEERKLF